MCMQHSLVVGFTDPVGFKDRLCYDDIASLEMLCSPAVIFAPLSLSCGSLTLKSAACFSDSSTYGLCCSNLP
jgi:hypothetical protein